MTSIKLKRRARPKSVNTSPVKILETELEKLRSDLRATVRAYAARLEIDLAESRAALGSLKPAEELSRERLHQLRDLMIHVRKRKLKPEKGRRKDLRKIDSLIEDLQLLGRTRSWVDVSLRLARRLLGSARASRAGDGATAVVNLISGAKAIRALTLRKVHGGEAPPS